MSDLFGFHRAMRAMRRAAAQRGVIAVLDVGTSKTACLVLRFEKPDRALGADGVGTLAGQSAFRVAGAGVTRSRGMRFGEIDSMSETERAIRTALRNAQKMADVRVDHVVACFSGGGPESHGLDGEAEVAGAAVSEDDVARALESCDMPGIGRDRELLHAQPVNFALDDRTGLGDPRGQAGKRLSCDMHLLAVDAAAVRNLANCVERCDMELAGIASSAYASGMSCLVEDEQELGAACVDMGGETTGISLFVKRHMIHAACVRLGGDHVTRDVSKGLRVPMQAAEWMKCMHGGVVATGMDDRDRIDIRGDTGDWERDRRAVTRSDLIGIVRPRVEEILELARARLDEAGFGHLPGQRIVLTGGASQVPGLDGLAPRILGNQVRLGRPLRLRGLPQMATDPSFASCVGLGLLAAHPQDEWWDFEMPSERYAARTLRTTMRWIRDNW